MGTKTQKVSMTTLLSRFLSFFGKKPNVEATLLQNFQSIMDKIKVFISFLILILLISLLVLTLLSHS